MAAGRWQDALDALRAVEAERELTDAEVEMLAAAAYGAGRLEATIAAWERLHTRWTAAGRTVEAARAATMVALHLMMDRRKHPVGLPPRLLAFRLPDPRVEPSFEEFKSFAI